MRKVLMMPLLICALLSACASATNEAVRSSDSPDRGAECPVTPRVHVGQTVNPIYTLGGFDDWFRYGDAVAEAEIVESMPSPPLIDGDGESSLRLRDVRLEIFNVLSGALPQEVWVRTSEPWVEGQRCFVHNIGETGYFALLDGPGPDRMSFLAPQAFVTYSGETIVDSATYGEFSAFNIDVVIFEQFLRELAMTTPREQFVPAAPDVLPEATSPPAVVLPGPSEETVGESPPDP